MNIKEKNNRMRQISFKTLLLLALLGGSTCAKAQDPVSGIIAGGIKRVIRAFDLQIQRIQTKTIWLQ